MLSDSTVKGCIAVRPRTSEIRPSDVSDNLVCSLAASLNNTCSHVDLFQTAHGGESEELLDKLSLWLLLQLLSIIHCNC